MLERLAERVSQGKSVNIHTPEHHLIRYNLYLENKRNDVSIYTTNHISEKELYKNVVADLRI